MPAPVSANKLKSFIEAKLAEAHIDGAGALAPWLKALLKPFVATIVAALQSDFDITPKANS